MENCAFKNGFKVATCQIDHNFLNKIIEIGHSAMAKRLNGPIADVDSGTFSMLCAFSRERM